MATAKVFPLHGLNTRANEDGLSRPEAPSAQTRGLGQGGCQARLGPARAMPAGGGAWGCRGLATRGACLLVAAGGDARGWAVVGGPSPNA